MGEAFGGRDAVGEPGVEVAAELGVDREVDQHTHQHQQEGEQPQHGDDDAAPQGGRGGGHCSARST